jgi:hypothetical protein
MDGVYLRAFKNRHRPLWATLLRTAFSWLYHVPGFCVETRSFVITAAVLGFLLLPHLATRITVGWLYNGPAPVS